MPKKSPLFVAAMLLAPALLPLCGCTNTLHDGVDMKGRVGFGVVVPQSGAYVVPGSNYYRGMIVAESTLNNGGGVEGKKVRVVSYESGGEREKGLDGVRRLARDFEAPFIAVALPRVVDRVAGEIGESRSVGLRLDGGPLPADAKSERLLRVFVSGRDEAALMAGTLAKEKAHRVLVLSCEDRYGEDTAGTLADALAKTGIVADRLPLRRDRPAVADIAAAVAKTAYDAVCIFGHGPEIPPALRALEKGGVAGRKIFGNHAFGAKSVTMLDLQPLRGARFTGPDFAARRDTPASDRFRSEYRRLYGDEPDLNAALGYDQVMIAFTAAKAVGTLSPVEIRTKIIADKTYEGAAGSYVFDTAGDGRLPLTVIPLVPAAGKDGHIDLIAPFSR